MTAIALRRPNATQTLKILILLTLLFISMFFMMALYPARSVDPVPLRPCKRCTGGCPCPRLAGEIRCGCP